MSRCTCGGNDDHDVTCPHSDYYQTPDERMADLASRLDDAESRILALEQISDQPQSQLQPQSQGHAPPVHAPSKGHVEQAAVGRRKKFQVNAIGFGSCQGCGLHSTLRTLDVAVAALPARKNDEAVPAGWCPLIALCGMCWDLAVAMLREKATPDSSGAISPSPSRVKSTVKVLEVKSSTAAVTIEIDVGGQRLFVSFQGPEVVANGWQPYDQPNPAAYIPMSRSELHAMEGAGGLLLVSGSTHQ